MDFIFGHYIHRVHLNKSPLKILEKTEHCHIQGLPKVFNYPLLSQEWVKLRTSNLAFGRYTHRVHQHKSPLKTLEKREHGHIQGLPIVFKYPLRAPIISGMGKATEFKFGQYIQRVHPNKSPLKILEKRERGYIQGLPKVFKYPLLSQEWVKLRTSNLVHIFTGSIGTKAH